MRNIHPTRGFTGCSRRKKPSGKRIATPHGPSPKFKNRGGKKFGRQRGILNQRRYP